MLLKDKISLITGSGKGIGKSIAINFAKEGSIIFVNDTNKYNAENTCTEIKKLKIKCYSYIADVGNPNEVQKMFEYILKKEGRIDVLVNNAGINKDSTLNKMRYEDWNKVIKVNLTGVFNCCRQAVTNMIENNYGKIINIASVVGLCGGFGIANYAASKAGIIGFTKSLAYEVAKKKITVNAIAPGFIKTDMISNMPKDIIEKIISRIPMGKLGSPDDIAKMAVFLASDDASYITGQVFSVNGGYLMQ